MHFVLDEQNNKVEAYTKEEILSVIAQAIADGTLAHISADAGFISKLKCACTGTTIKEAFITQAQYNALEAAGTLDAHTEYNIIDDTTCEDIDNALKEINADLGELKPNVSNLNNDLSELNTVVNNIKQFSESKVYFMIAPLNGYTNAQTLYKNDGSETYTDYEIIAMPTGKTLNDVVAMRGTFYIKLSSSNDYYYPVTFSGFSNSIEIGEYKLSIPSNLLSSNLLMLFNCLAYCGTYDGKPKFKITLRNCYKVPSMEALSIYEIRLAELVLYFN